MEVMAQPPKASEQNKCPLGGAGPEAPAQSSNKASILEGKKQTEKKPSLFKWEGKVSVV